MKGLIFTYLLTYGGAVASLFNPFIGLLIYICFSIIRPEALWYWSVPAGNYSRIVAIGLLVGWAFNGFGNWKLGQARHMVIAFVCYYLWALISGLVAPDRELAFRFLEPHFKILLPFVVAITTIDSIAKLKQLAWVITLSAGYLAWEMNRSYISGYNPLEDEFAGMDNNCVAISMVTTAGVAFFLGMESRKWWLKGLAYFLAACMVHVILFSMSRGGMLGLMIMSGIIFVLIPKKPSHYLVFVLAILVGLRMAGPEVRTRFMMTFSKVETQEGAGAESTAQSRIVMWGACRDAMMQHPFFGLGPDHFPQIMPQQYGYPKGLMAHSLWLQMGADIGIPGLLFLVSFYALCGRRCWRLTRKGAKVTDPWFVGASRMVVASLVGFAVSAQFVSLHGLEVPYYVALIGAGVLKLNSAPQKRVPAPLQAGFTAVRPQACAVP